MSPLPLSGRNHRGNLDMVKMNDGPEYKKVNIDGNRARWDTALQACAIPLRHWTIEAHMSTPVHRYVVWPEARKSPVNSKNP